MCVFVQDFPSIHFLALIQYSGLGSLGNSLSRAPFSHPPPPVPICCTTKPFQVSQETRSVQRILGLPRGFRLVKLIQNTWGASRKHPGSDA